MSGKGTRVITSTGLFIALGVLFPVIFHAAGGPGLGKVLLPMHIPVLLAGILSGPVTGLFSGAITPLASAVLTGMPALMPPVAQAMSFELGAYGWLAGILSHRLRFGVVQSLVTAMVGGRLVYGLLGAFILPVLGFKRVPPLYPVTGGVVAGLPGIAVQIALIPAVVTLLRQFRGQGKRAQSE